MMFARVIPIVRTPLGIEGFDYRIPEDQSLREGDLVVVPFRRRRTIGLVVGLFADSPFAERALSVECSYGNLRFSKAFVELLQATAERTFSSSSSVLKSWLRELPKRPPTLSITAANHPLTGLEATWQEHPGTALLARAKQVSSERRVLIVTPWVTRARWLTAQLPGSLSLHSELAAGAAFQHWTTFLSNEAGCLVTTKIGAWMASMSDLVLLDEPEQDDHKQDELTPRYDARKVLLWCAQKGVTRVESFGLTPPLHASVPAPPLSGCTQIFVHHPGGRTAIPCLQADALEALLAHAGPRLIIHPIRGLSARIVCRDCLWQAACTRCGAPLSADRSGAVCRSCGQRADTPLTCPACGGAELDRGFPGIERLRARWEKVYPEETVEWRDLTAEQLEAPLPPQVAVLLTDASLLGVGEDIRRPERQCIAFRRLADRVNEVNGTLLVQCRESFRSSVSAWMTAEGMQTYVQHEREERRAFGYPPAFRLVKFIFKGSFPDAERWQEETQARLQHAPLQEARWRGPLPVEHQSKTRGTRFIFHLTLSPDVSETLLIETLRPLVSEHVLVDLDPIAFLR